MCGICGIYRPNGIEKEHVDIFNKIFEQSESRGSDAFGFCTHPKNVLFKSKGKVTSFLKDDKMQKRMYKLLKGNKVVLAHTRSTTTGTEKKNRNNHPFSFSNGDFSLAHNGVIWNHEHLRGRFKTDIETDSIVILKLIQEEYDKSKNIAKAIGKMAEEVRGSYACWLLVKKTGSVYFFRHNNPIYLGYSVGRDMYAFASDKDFLSFLEEKLKQKLGFKAGLAYADIEENVIYRLTDGGLNVMGKFKPSEYSYSNQGGYYGNQSGYCNDSQITEVEGKSVNQLEDKRTSVTDRITFEDALWNDYGIPATQLMIKLDYFGISLVFNENWVEIQFEKCSVIYLGELLALYGLTVSPKTDSLRVEYPDLITAVLDIREVIEEEM